MRRLRALLSICFAVALPAAALSQSTPLQGGAWTPGHAPMYSASTSQPVMLDSGQARGGDVGQGLAELLLQARGTGAAPYDAQGTGPYGSISCVTDGPITAANGYHYLCFSASSGNAGLIAYGAGGIASPQPLKFNINGTVIAGVTCTGTPTSSFATINGIVTHC